MDKINIIKENISAIKRLRLTTNSETEWEKRYNSLRFYRNNNSYSLFNKQETDKESDSDINNRQHKRQRNHDAETEFIYKSLYYDCYKTHEINLDEFLEEYRKSSKKADGFINKFKRTKYWTPNIICNFILESFKPYNDFTGYHEIKSKYLYDLMHIDSTLLFCWVYKLLPYYDEMTGNVESDSLKEQFIKASKKLENMYKETSRPESPFAISTRKTNFDTKENLTRLDLYKYVNIVLSNIIDVIDPNEMHETSYNAEYINLSEICRNNNVIWEDSNNHDLWTFDLYGNSYIFTQYITKSEEYVAYEGCMFNEFGASKIIIHSPLFINSFVNNENEESSMMRKASISFSENEIKINDIPRFGDLNVLPELLKKQELTPKIKSRIKNYTNKYEDLAYPIKYVQRLMSPHFIFIEKDRIKLDSGLGHVTSWYRIPVLSEVGLMLKEICIDDVICNIDIKGKKYICFPHFNKSLDVTTIDDCNRLNISIVKYPIGIECGNSMAIAVDRSEMVKRDNGVTEIITHATVLQQDSDDDRKTIIKETFTDNGNKFSYRIETE